MDEQFLSRRQAQRDQEREIDKLRTLEALFAAYVRTQGRVRIAKADVDAMKGKITMSLKRDGDHVLVSWVEPEAG